jgi:hypothetical protein
MVHTYVVTRLLSKSTEWLQIGFLVLTLIGVTIPMLMANPNKMIRTDGTKVTTPRHPSWKVEFKGLRFTSGITLQS